MRHILVGLDLSSQSATVLKFALRLAQYHQIDLTVVHVLDHDNQEVNDRAEEPNWEQAFQALKAQKSSQLEQFVQQYYGKQYHEVKIDTEIRFGYIHEELQRVADERSTDLLVVGKLTKTGNLFFSDTSDQLINHLPCPLFIVPEDAEFHAFKQMVYGTSFIIEDCASILYLQRWLKVFGAQLICLHICKNQEMKESAERKLAILEQLFPQEQISFRIMVADVDTGIDRYLKSTQADLVATTHQIRGIWEGLFKKSFSKAIASNIEIPMLVFQQH